VAERWNDPTAAGAVYLDPTAPVFIAPIVLPEPDPVYRDDALFASASGNWRPPPIPVPPVPVLNEAGELTLLAVPPPPSAADLRDQAVAALIAPPAHYQAPASRGGARSTYTQPPPPPAQRASRRPPPARPPGSVTSSPATWLPSSGPGPTTPWRGPAGPATWLPTSGGSPTAAGPGGRGPVTYLPTGGPRPTGGRRRTNKGWIPGVLILAFIVLANVLPHLGNVFHRGTPADVNRSVDGYYTSVEARNVTTAASFVCAAGRAAWTTGQRAASSDTKRDILSHTITSTHSDGGDNYTVQVSLVFGVNGSGSAEATLKVLKDSDSGGEYRVCGGTNP
jgi:hypothetical protein